MSFVQRELDRIRSALSSNSERYAELYAAQQALAWVLEPTGFKPPFETITMGTQEGSGDYSERSHPPQSLDIRGGCAQQR